MLTTEWNLEDALRVRGEEAERRGEKRGRLEGRLEGKLEGKLEGEQEATRKFIKQMYQGGFSIADIVKATKLQEQEIKDILGL